MVGAASCYPHVMSEWVEKTKEKSELGMILSQSIYDDDDDYWKVA